MAPFPTAERATGSSSPFLPGEGATLQELQDASAPLDDARREALEHARQIDAAVKVLSSELSGFEKMPSLTAEQTEVKVQTARVYEQHVEWSALAWKTWPRRLEKDAEVYIVEG